jgi:hypothetical protein
MKYTGFDGNVKAKRPAMDAWIKNALAYSQLKNLGSWVVREQRSNGAVNHAGIPSVHGTGRAVDIGFSGVKDGRAKCEHLLELLTTNYKTLGVEMILDYYPKPFGRGWRVDRKTWQTYTKATIAGAPGGNWIHVEIAPKLLETVAGVSSAWTLIKALKPIQTI